MTLALCSQSSLAARLLYFSWVNKLLKEKNFFLWRFVLVADCKRAAQASDAPRYIGCGQGKFPKSVDCGLFARCRAAARQAAANAAAGGLMTGTSVIFSEFLFRAKVVSAESDGRVGYWLNRRYQENDILAFLFDEDLEQYSEHPRWLQSWQHSAVKAHHSN
jgi:hypothetical protein